MISIIIPTLNSQRFIKGTLQSLVNAGQAGDFEVIVVDGGSSDETISIVNEYATKIPIRVFRQLGKGMYSAINQGIQCSSGEIVGYLNSDDELMPGSLCLVRKMLSDSDSVVVYGDIYYIDPDGEEIARLRFSAPSYRTFISCMSMPIAQPGTFWKRSAHEYVGYFDECYSLAGDFDFFCRLRGIFEFTNLGAPIARYRIHKHSLTNTNTELGREEVSRIRAHYGSPLITRFEMYLRGVIYRIRYSVINFPALHIIRRRKRQIGLAL